MKKIAFAILFLVSLVSKGQVSKVSLQASGLTCSMCSNAINKSLSSLDYVEKVSANIKNSTFEVTFRQGAKVNFDELKKKVEVAGFSVAHFSAQVNFDNTQIKNDNHVAVGDMTFHFLNVKDQKLGGIHEITLLDKGYVTAKQFKKNERLTEMSCYKTGVAGTCCASYGLSPGKRIFHVTI